MEMVGGPCACDYPHLAIHAHRQTGWRRHDSGGWTLGWHSTWGMGWGDELRTETVA